MVQHPCGETPVWSSLSCSIAGHGVMDLLHGRSLPSESRDAQKWTKDQRTHTAILESRKQMFQGAAVAEARPLAFVIRHAT